jgi:hypothetical protein
LSVIPELTPVQEIALKAHYWAKLFEFLGASAVASGAMSWFRRGSKEEDEMVAAAHDVNLNGLSDADFNRGVECMTDRNLRDQMSVEQAENLNRERELRRFPNRN